MASSARTRPSSRVRLALTPWRSHGLLLSEPFVELLVLDSFARQPRFLLFKELVVIARART
jgi:hypothetical protein